MVGLWEEHMKACLHLQLFYIFEIISKRRQQLPWGKKEEEKAKEWIGAKEGEVFLLRSKSPQTSAQVTDPPPAGLVWPS